MSEISRKIESAIDKKLAKKQFQIDDGFKKNKVINEVLDKSTVMTLYNMIKRHVIAYVNGVQNAGKESVLFWGVDDNGCDVALKIYLVTTSNFKKRQSYILGDPRFRRIKKGTRNLVYLWAQKEFRNLTQCYNAGIAVPKPRHISNNVLAMDFIGEHGVPANLLLESAIEQQDYEETIKIIKDMYKRARLVHGDLSEYNIFKTDRGLVVFDLGSAVDVCHPCADEFLKRDIYNINRFFSKRGVLVEEPKVLFKVITE